MKKQFQFLFIFAAMILCCGNVFAGDSKKYYAKIQVTSQGGGKVYVNHGSGTPSYANTACWGPTYLTGDKNIDFDMYASPDAGYKFDRWEADEITTIKTQTGNKDKVTVYSTQTNSSQAPTGYVKAYFVEDVVKYQIKIQRPNEGSISLKSSYSKDSITTLYSTDAKSESSLYVLEADTVTLMAQNGNSDKTFTAWYKVENGNKILLSYANPYKGFFTANTTIYAEYNNNNFLVGGNQYKTLSDAKGAINDINKTIILLKDYIISENTEIPSGVTLLIPNNENHVVYTTEPGAHHSYKAIDGVQTDFKIDRSFVYRKLSINPGYTLTINGSVSIGAWRWCPTDLGSFGATIPNTTGSFRVDQGYGLIDMGAESSIVLKSGSNLYCWGRIRGNGTVIAESGATVYESWVYTDMRDNNAYECIYYDTKCFPMNQYYIQDIQVPITFHNGSSEILATGMYVDKGVYPYIGKITWIGSSKSFFKLLNDSSSVTKKYDVASDRLIYDLMGDVDIDYAQLSISASISTETFSTNEALFDLTNNNTINIFGNTTIKYDLALAAGAELNIEKDANVTLAYRASLYAFDSEDWGDFACKKKIVPLFLPQYELSENCANFYSNNGITPDTYVGYTSYKAIRTEDNIADAKIKINGTLIIKGGNNSLFNEKNYKSGLYSTNHGAQIYSSLGGNIVYEEGAGTQDTVSQLWEAGKGDSKNCLTLQQTWVPIVPAKLLNANGQYLETALYTEPTVFEYENGMWGVKKLIKTIDINDEKTIVVEKNENGEETTTEQPTNTYTIQSGSIVETTDTISISLGSTLVVEENASIDANTVAISSSPSDIDADNDQAGSSSQIAGEGSITTTNAYIDIKMDPSGKLDGSKYYSFAVPFKVDVTNGVEKIDSKGNISSAVLDRDYRVYTYRGDLRAANGANGSAWEVVSKGNFVPGVFYLVEFADGSCNVFRFHMISGDTLNNVANLELAANMTQTGDGADGGWNGIANTALQNATITVDEGLVAQIFDPDKKIFITVQLNQMSFAVGAAMMIQVAGKTTATNSAAPQQQANTPMRMLAQPKDVTFGTYAIRIAAANASKMADQLFVSASEHASDNYVIGKDLVKMFMGNATVAQLWVNDYGKRLSMNQSLLVDNIAESSLTLYAPKAGNYKIYLKAIPEDATIFLLHNGSVVANLNEGAYSVVLAKGDNDKYGLRITAKKTPGVITSIDEALVGNGGVRKVLLNGNIYIIRDGKMYNSLGAQL